MLPAAVVALLSLAPSAARGQDLGSVFLQQQRELENEVRAALNRDIPATEKADWQYGGWFSFYTFLWDDGINSSRTFRRYDTRIWSSLSLDGGAHQFYVRGKLLWEDFNHGDSYDRDEDDVIGPNLDRGFYQFDLRNAIRAYRDEHLDWNLNFKIGRDLVEFGTGYALSLPMDHFRIALELGDFLIEGLGGRTFRSLDDIDVTRPGGGRSDRVFWGTQITYTGFERHRPFIYAFWNEDQKLERPVDPFQNYDYDTWYIGAGSTGELFQDVRYRAELVHEGGNSYGDRRIWQRSDVDAWALNVMLEYLPKWRMAPRFSLEYMFATGDSDRRINALGSYGGNRHGTDTGFIGFGYRDTGLAFAPWLSNIHIWRGGASFRPFEKSELFRQFELGTDWFLYSKHHSDGAVSDPTVTLDSGYLGWEMDYFANWRITSDLAWTIRYGAFFPGAAFVDQTTRTFFLVGFTWSF